MIDDGNLCAETITMTASLAVRAMGYVPLQGSNHPLMDITRIAKGPKHWCTEERRSDHSHPPQ